MRKPRHIPQLCGSTFVAVSKGGDGLIGVVEGQTGVGFCWESPGFSVAYVAHHPAPGQARAQSNRSSRDS